MGRADYVGLDGDIKRLPFVRIAAGVEFGNRAAKRTYKFWQISDVFREFQWVAMMARKLHGHRGFFRPAPASVSAHSLPCVRDRLADYSRPRRNLGHQSSSGSGG